MSHHEMKDKSVPPPLDMIAPCWLANKGRANLKQTCLWSSIILLYMYNVLDNIERRSRILTLWINLGGNTNNVFFIYWSPIVKDGK